MTNLKSASPALENGLTVDESALQMILQAKYQTDDADFNRAVFEDNIKAVHLFLLQTQISKTAHGRGLMLQNCSKPSLKTQIRFSMRSRMRIHPLLLTLIGDLTKFPSKREPFLKPNIDDLRLEPVSQDKVEAISERLMAEYHFEIDSNASIAGLMCHAHIDSVIATIRWYQSLLMMFVKLPESKQGFIDGSLLVENLLELFTLSRCDLINHLVEIAQSHLDKEVRDNTGDVEPLILDYRDLSNWLYDTELMTAEKYNISGLESIESVISKIKGDAND